MTKITFKPTDEQKKIFKYIEKRKENLLIEARAGCGKCLGIDTPVLMYDGSIKLVQDIVIGDKLMGDDNQPRTVLSTNTGYGELFKITPTKGDSWICNDVHVMTLHDDRTKKIIDIPLNELSEHPRYSNNGNLRNYRLQRTGVDFEEINTVVDPYLIGLWLGDDNKSLKSTNVKRYSDNSGSYSVALTMENHDNTRKNTNIVNNEFKSCKTKNGDIGIPRKYLINSVEKRYRLLGGLIDSGGHYSKENYLTITTKYDKLKDDILYLCRSLGLSAYSSIKKATIKELNLTGDYHSISISGDYSNIFSLKNDYYCRKQINSVLRTEFKYHSIGLGEYYGFTLDGNGRFLLGDFTITHNTSTIVEATKLMPKDSEITFLAFNKHIQEELKEKLPEYVRCYTMHGVGMGAILRKYPKIKMDQFKVDHIINKKAKTWNLNAEYQSTYEIMEYKNALKTFVNLCRSTLTMDKKWMRILAEKYDIKYHTDKDLKRVSSILEILMNDRETYDFTDMVFLPAIDPKIWLFPQDYVIVDEAQDLNRAQHRMIEKMLKKDRVSKKVTGRLIAVGDPHQCQPKGTKVLMYDGSNKNIEDIQVGDRVVSYNKKNKGTFLGYYKNQRDAESMRNHTPVIEEVSKHHICERLISIESNGSTTKYTGNHRCFVRFRPDKTKAHGLYLMERDGYFRIGIIPLWGYGNNSVTVRSKQEQADKFWLLNLYENKHDAYCDEQYYSLFFGIPQLRFKDNKTGLFTQEKIDKFYSRFDKVIMMSGAIKLLNHFNKIYAYPLWEKGQKNYISKVDLFEIRACNIIGDYMQMIHFNENNIHIRTHGNGRSDKQVKVEYHNIDNLTYEHYDDFVYSLKVSKHENYVADGMLTHNSIYSFAGSDNNSFEWFRKFKSTKTLPLTYTFRCAKEIVRKANEIVKDIKALDTAPEGQVRKGCVVSEPESGDFVLCRTVRPLVALFFLYLLEGRKATIKGSDVGRSLIEMTQGLKTTSQVMAHWVNELEDYRVKLRKRGILNYDDDIGYTSLEDKVNTLNFLAKMSKDVVDLRTKIDTIFTDEVSGIVLSTVHKSKGLEADRVFIARPDILPMGTPKAWQYQQEKNLEYVAYTRAKRELIFDEKWSDEENKE